MLASKVVCKQAPGKDGRKFGERETEEWAKRSAQATRKAKEGLLS